MTDVLAKRGNLDRDTDSRKIMGRGTSRSQPSINRERPGTDPSLMAFRRNQPCQHFDLIFLGPTTMKKYISAKPLSVVLYLKRKTNYLFGCTGH